MSPGRPLRSRPSPPHPRGNPAEGARSGCPRAGGRAEPVQTGTRRQDRPAIMRDRQSTAPRDRSPPPSTPFPSRNARPRASPHYIPDRSRPATRSSRPSQAAHLDAGAPRPARRGPAAVPAGQRPLRARLDRADLEQGLRAPGRDLQCRARRLLSSAQRRAATIAVVADSRPALLPRPLRVEADAGGGAVAADGRPAHRPRSGDPETQDGTGRPIGVFPALPYPDHESPGGTRGGHDSTALLAVRARASMARSWSVESMDPMVHTASRSNLHFPLCHV